MDYPLISIIVTTYNYAHTVGTAIDSALRQDYPNLEVVVVDNASTDATPELAAKYAADPRFRYIRNPENIGMVPNHNKGLIESRGTYVLFLSADDFLMPHHISRSYAYLMDHPQIDVLYTSTYFVDQNETFIGRRQMNGQPLAIYTGGRDEFAGLLTEGCYMCFPTMLMRRDLYDRYGLLDEEIKAADYEIVVRWAAAGVRFGYIPEATCVVRLHADQQSSSQNYVADAGDITEFIYLVKKFAAANGALLDGYESSVSRHMWWRWGLAQQAGVKDDDGKLRAQMLECDGILTAARESNVAAPRKLTPTIIILPGVRINEVECTMRSLVAQTFEGWNAIAIEYATSPFAALGEYLDPKGRISGMRMLGELNETMLVNQALRIASGNVFLVLRPGSVIVPEHLERIVAAMIEYKSDLVRTSATYGGRPVYMPPAESRCSYIAPFGPTDALVFTRRALDLGGGMNGQIAPYADWEFYLRASGKTPLVSLDSPVALTPLPPHEAYPPIAVLPAFARQIHAAYATEDQSIILDRSAYLRNLDAAVAAGQDALATPEGHVRLIEAAFGTGLFAGVR
jgi:glycosyltransferase involved in cell wall biosynthesis